MGTLLTLVLAGLVIYLAARGFGRGATSSGPRGRIGRRSICNWHPTGRSHGALKEYKCKTCSKVAYSSLSGGPVYCRKDTSGGQF